MKKTLLLLLIVVGCNKAYDACYDARVTKPAYSADHPLVVIAPSPVVPLLRLGPTATTRAPHPHVVRSGGNVRNVEFGALVSANGWSQAIAVEPRSRPRRFSLPKRPCSPPSATAIVGSAWNLPGCDNKQFAVNIMHWLSRADTSP